MPKYRIHSALLITLVAIAIWTLLRTILWLDVGPAQLNLTQTLGIFGLGAWFDLATLACITIPWLVGAVWIPYRIRASIWAKKMTWVGIAVLIYALLFGAIAEYIFWQEFTTRFNFIAVDYLIYTHEVIGNIRESYPVPLILMLIALLTGVITLSLMRYITLSIYSYSLKNKYLFSFLLLLLPALSVQYSNIDQMEFSLNSYANELSGNGLYSFAAAARRNELDYDKFYKTIPQAQADRILLALGLERAPLSKHKPTHLMTAAFSHDTPNMANPFKRPPKNIVLISVESLSASYLGTYGNQENLTPYLDALAKESLVFDKAFATGTRTVRGLDALSIGTPPIPGQAIVHRPHNAHLATIGEFLEAQHYATFFVYGGYGMFDNMNNYFRGNDYRVIDRTDFNQDTIQSENIWGVDDESLFNNTLQILDQQAQLPQPFFAHVMTTSNHRPYTFPAGKIDLPQGSRASAVKYTDYAIGQFINEAKRKPWFNDTLFVIVADHCASVAGKTKLPVDKYHIPLFFYAPALLPAGRHTRMVSQIDIAPTLIALLDAQGSHHFFGENIFSATAQPNSARAFISNYQSLGYYKNDKLVVLSPKQGVEMFHVDPHTFESTLAPLDKTLVAEAIAYYQTASRAYKLGDLSEFAHAN